MRRSRWSRTLVVLVVLVSMLALVGAGSALAQPPERVKVLIGFTHQPGPAEQALVHRAGGTIKYTYHLVPAIAATVPETAIDGLRRNPNVTHVELDGEVYAVDDELDNTWGVKRIGAGTVHDGGNKGLGVKVAVIDTGIDYTHLDLDANYVDGYDFVNSDSDPMDDDGHGTHVAGTIAAEDNDIGVVGVAPEAALYALKVLDETGRGYVSDVIAGIEWAVDPDGDTDTPDRLDVINMSLGGGGTSDLEAACQTAYDAGVLLVAAAGNNGNPPGIGDKVIYPAAYDTVIAVAATDQSDERARWSSTGPDLELSAPGVSINSTLLGGEYDTGSGTSMASPHVAGTAALVIASGITGAANVRQQLISTAEDLGDAGWDTKYGWGLVDAAEAAALPSDTTPPAKVTGLGVTTVSCAQLNLAWYANTETDFHHYNVYRSTTSGSADDLIASPTTNSYSDTGPAASTAYYYVVTAVDTSGNEGDASDEASGMTSADDLGPVTSNVVADPNPTNGATSVTLTADVSDATPCNSDIVAAEYFVGTVGADGSGTPMNASDGAFDSSTEGVTASIDVSGWAVGLYTLNVHGKDSAGNWGATESVVLDVTEAPSNIMYVESIVFSPKVAGPNKFLYTTVKVVDGDEIPLGGVGVRMTLTWAKEGDTIIDDSWKFAGDTGEDGTVLFTLRKAASGFYTGKVTNLILTPYIWKGGVTSDSCVLNDDGTITFPE